MRKFLSFFALALLFVCNATAQIKSVDEIDESKVYTIVASRAVLTQNGSELKCNYDFDNFTENEYWAFVKYAGNYYLYSVGSQKFVQALPQYGSRLQNYSTSALNFVDSGDETYPICLRIARWGVNTQSATGDNAYNIALNSYVDADAGNMFAITEVAGETFDASSVRNALEQAYSTLTGQIFTLVGERGGLTMTNGNLKPTGNDGNLSAYEELDSTNPMQQFAFVLYKSQLYVYNVGQDKFLYGTNGTITGRDFEGTVYNILYDEESKKFMFTYGTGRTLNNNNQGSVILDSYSPSDGGNVFTLTKVSDFDDSALQDKLNTADVIFTIEDADGEVLGTRTIKRPVGELTISPTFDELNIRYYSNIDLKAPITVEAGVTNNATLVLTGWEGPFTASATLDDDAYWYAFNIRQTNIGLIANDGALNVTTAYSLDDVLADDVWAFKGNNVDGFGIYNKKSGLYLTKPVNPDANNTDKYCTLSATPNNDWLIMPTGTAAANENGAFLLYEKSDTKNKLNQLGGATSTTLGYYDHTTDPGNFFYTSAPINFVKTVIEEILENPVGLINGFVSEESKSDFNERYNDLASSENLADFIALYEELLDNLLKLNTGWYQLENQYANNKFALEAAADGALIGQHTLAEAANNISTFVKYDAETKTVMLQGKYVPTHSSSAEGAMLSENGGHISFNPVTGGSCLLAFTCDDVDAGYSYRYLYFNYDTEVYTLRTWYTTTNASNTHWYMHPKKSFDITLHEGEGEYWATMYAPFGYTLPADAEAYIGKVNEAGNSLSLISIGQNVPAGTAVIIKAKGGSITATINDDIADITDKGDLTGQYLAYSEQTYEVYTLGIYNGVVGFYLYDDIIGANKAVLRLANSGNANGYKFVIDDDDITGIDDATSAAKAEQGAYYDLQGRRVATPQKGQLYIVNGKTVVYQP